MAQETALVKERRVITKPREHGSRVWATGQGLDQQEELKQGLDSSWGHAG